MRREVSPPLGGKGDRTRQRILDAAAHLIADVGVTAASLSDIARSASLQPGSLYFHFGSKEEVVGEVLAVGMDEAIGHLEEAVKSAEATPLARLTAAIRAHFDARLEMSAYARVVLKVAPDWDRTIGGRYEQQRRRYAEQWLDLIRAAQVEEEFAAGLDPRLVRELCLAAVNVELHDRWTGRDAATALASMLRLA